MATTTPNYGWDVPTSSDYVKNGAVAIETLGDDIDASLFSITGGKNVGFVHLNSTNFSASSGVAINNIFTSTYQSYKIVISNLSCASSSQTIVLRLRASGTNSTTGYYYSGFYSYTPGSVLVFSGAANNPYFEIATANQTHKTGSIFELQNPFLAVATGVQGQRAWWDGSNVSSFTHNGVHTPTTSYDGFEIAPFGSTMTGTVSVFGYRSA